MLSVHAFQGSTNRPARVSYGSVQMAIQLEGKRRRHSFPRLANKIACRQREWVAKTSLVGKRRRMVQTLDPQSEDVEDNANKNAEVHTVTRKQRFCLELAVLQVGRDLLKASTIRDLHPFFAQVDGLLRIQTRLRNVEYHEGIKHLTLLPSDHIPTELIATGAGVATIIAELQERFWVTKARHCVTRVIERCTWCAQSRVKPTTAPMAALPADRGNVSKPFDVTGVDFIGPAYIVGI